MKRAFIIVFSLIFFTALFPAHAGNLASLSIISRQTGEPIRVWRHAGRNYIVGISGEAFSLQIQNKLGERLLSVVAIDGINVISGETASPSQTGYILQENQPLNIDGWRKSTEQVAAFYFTNLTDSYAARTGRASQTGVIGVALYREKSKCKFGFNHCLDSRELLEANPSRTNADNSDVRRKSAEGKSLQGENESRPLPLVPTEKLGTGHGERIQSTSRFGDFFRATESPSEVLTVYYDSYINLVNRGIIPRHIPHDRATGHPSPFPGHFVRDPM